MAETFNNGVESLEARYRHLDDRVGRQGQELASIAATLTNVSNTLDTISKRVNEPQRTQWASIIAGCAFVASLGYSALNPVQANLAKQEVKLEAIVARQRDVAGMIGEFTARERADDERHLQVAKSIEKLAERSYDTHGDLRAVLAKLNSLEKYGLRAKTE